LCADAAFQRVGATFGCHSMGVDRPRYYHARDVRRRCGAPVTSSVLGASPKAAVIVVVAKIPRRARLDRFPAPGEAPQCAVGWRALLTVGDEDAEDEEQVAVYCPECAAREFGGP
jgi:hypothetical protein